MNYVTKSLKTFTKFLTVHWFWTSQPLQTCDMCLTKLKLLCTVSGSCQTVATLMGNAMENYSEDLFPLGLDETTIEMDYCYI